MLEAESPAWLLALLIVPLVWWLHRFRSNDHRVPVSSVALWVTSSAPDNSGSRQARPKPIWLLRALIVVLMVLGLSGLRWVYPGAQPVTVWLDNSASMYTREEAGTRIETGLAGLVEHLRQLGASPVTVRSLGNPGDALRLDSVAPGRWLAQIREWITGPARELVLPVPDAMAVNRAHWIVTDGASAHVRKWAVRAPVSRVISSGTQTENVALTQLVLRRQLAEPGQYKALLSVVNAGDEEADRLVQVFQGGELVYSEQLVLAPAQQADRILAVDPDGELPFKAMLTPQDALALDDELAIDRSWSRSLDIALSGRCGSALQAALGAHPALRVSVQANGSRDLTIVCGALATDNPGPVLSLPASGTGTLLSSAPLWRTGSGSLRSLVLEPDWISLPHSAPFEPPGASILVAGGIPLITVSVADLRVYVRFDLAAEALVKQPEYPLLVLGLLELVLDKHALAGITNASRNPDSAGIRPYRIQPSVQRAQVVSDNADYTISLATHLLLAILVLVLLDLLLLWRGQLGRNRTAPTSAGLGSKL